MPLNADKNIFALLSWRNHMCLCFWGKEASSKEKEKEKKSIESYSSEEWNFMILVTTYKLNQYLIRVITSLANCKTTREICDPQWVNINISFCIKHKSRPFSS
jgi:hypothetical protein